MRVEIPLLTWVWSLFLAGLATATTLDDIGVTQLRSVNPALTGSGVIVAQPEATSIVSNVDQDNFEVNPGSVGQPASKFTYINSTGATAVGMYPNAVGTASSHANSVGSNFFGATTGVAPDVSQIFSYNANRFLNSVILSGTPITAQVVNQSFVGNNSVQGGLDTYYDNYVAAYGTIIVSGLGNSGSPITPSTAYNVIAVAAFGGSTSVGPTYPSASRSKPDITAPASATSFSTPYVAGSAAVLVQAGNLNLGGTGTSALATDDRTIKALLLNGATKPSNWTNNLNTALPKSANTSVPLDRRYGAGIVNVYDSYQDLTAGVKLATETNNSSTPSVALGDVGTRGWNLTQITSTASDRVDHYVIDVGLMSDFKATLVWERPFQTITDIDEPPTPLLNNLDLLLYNVNTAALVASSISTVDNVEHIYLTGLAPGRYDLQVLKHGGTVGVTPGVISNGEIYALAFAVPEPTSLILALVGGAFFVAIRRRTGRAFGSHS